MANPHELRTLRYYEKGDSGYVETNCPPALKHLEVVRGNYYQFSFEGVSTWRWEADVHKNDGKTITWRFPSMDKTHDDWRDLEKRILKIRKQYHENIYDLDTIPKQKSSSKLMALLLITQLLARPS